MLNKLAFLLGCQAQEVDASAPLSALGVDSLAAVELANWCTAEVLHLLSHSLHSLHTLPSLTAISRTTLHQIQYPLLFLSLDLVWSSSP